MAYYDDIYKLRLNRYGLNYQSRIQNKREKEFQLYLAKSVYKVEFIYNSNTEIGSFEKYKQDETKTLHYLLTNTSLNIAPGTVLQIPNKDGVNEPWMVYYLEDIKASGYNRYIMLRMTHYLTWMARDKSEQHTYAYMYGQENNMLKDELKSRSRMDTIYTENLKSSFFICPVNEHIKKDDYFIVGEQPLQEYYRVTGYDIQSTEGIEYVTVDPIYEYDLTPPPVLTPTDDRSEFFWLNGGTLGAQDLHDKVDADLFTSRGRDLIVREEGINEHS